MENTTAAVIGGASEPAPRLHLVEQDGDEQM